MIKKIKIGKNEVELKVTALLPVVYRQKIGRDIIVDIQKLQSTYSKILDKNNPQNNFDGLDLTIFMNLAWTMAYHAYTSRLKEANKIANTEARNEEISKIAVIPDNPEDWMDEFDGVFDIYEALPQIIELWNVSSGTTSKPGKK